jgi:probable rRNA maturation factor
MLEIEVAAEEPWTGDWDRLADEACRAALARTAQLEWANSPALIEVSVRLTSDEEVHALNRDYRQKDKPTNVLSFPMIQPDLLASVAQNSDDGEVLLGDIVLAHGVCAAEAAERGVTVEAHAQHLIVHGMLHLLGHDHMNDAEAEAMEAIERDALSALGLHDPYPVRED